MMGRILCFLFGHPNDEKKHFLADGPRWVCRRCGEVGRRDWP